MMFKSHFGETVVVVIALIMGLVMSLAAIFLNHLPLNFSTVFSIWGLVVLVVLLVSIVLPYKAWSARLIGAFLAEGTPAYRLADNIFPSLIFNTFNTVVISGVNILYNDAIPAAQQTSIWIQSILHDWPIMFVVSYFAALFAEAMGVCVAKKCCTGGK